MKHLQESFSKIYDQYIEKIYRFVDIAQDITSETFLRCWQAYQKNNPNNEIKNVSAFLYKIARNLVIDHYREKGRTDVVSVDFVTLNDQKPGLEEKIAINSELEQMKTAISKLRDDYQNIIIWYYLEEMSVPEIAQMLGKTEQATRVMIHRALKSLKGHFGQV